MPRVHPRRYLVAVTAFAVLAGGALLSLALGEIRIPVRDVVEALGGTLDPENLAREIVIALRLPRVVTAIAVGAALGAAGAVLQGALTNPLAAPDVIGVTGGAGFGAMLVILVFPASIALQPVLALAGGLCAAGLVLLVAWTGARAGGVPRIILAGIAVGSLFTAATAALLAVFPDQAAAGVSFLAGRLQFEGWETLRIAWPYVVAGLLAAIVLIRPLDRLALGDDVARSLGTRPRLVRFVAVATAAVLAAAAAAMAGLLGFVGLIVPHVVRLAGRTSAFGFVIPASAVAGAALLVTADLLARTVAPIELPVGPLVIAVGVPLFLWLLQRDV